MTATLRGIRRAWPREVLVSDLQAEVALLASHAGTPAVVQLVGRRGRVEHRLRIDEGKTAALTTQLRSVLPGLGIEGVSDEESLPSFDRAITLRLSTRRRPLRSDQPELTSRALLHALADVGKDEALILEWVLVAPLLPVAVPNKLEHLNHEKLAVALLQAPFGTARAADAETRAALRAKRGLHGWKAIGRIAVKAASVSRQRQLIRGVLQALRTAEGPGVQITARSTRAVLVNTTKGKATIRLNTDEFMAVCGSPIGLTGELPVTRILSRRLPVPPGLPRGGREVGESTWPGQPRRLALTTDDSLRHLHVLGPTGVGKSTLLLHLIEQDMRAGRGVVVIEPKGDLIDDVLARVPENRIDDVVLIDPTDTEAVAGFNPLAPTHGVSPDLVADQLLGTFHSLYDKFWGPRTSDILHAALLTLARTPSMTLAALPLLLTNTPFRRSIIGRLHDPLGLEPFWAGYEAWSEAERATAIAPVLNKLRPFIMRPALRRVIGQSEPRFSTRDVFTKRRIVLAKIQKGVLGPEASQLHGALLVADVVAQAQSRTQIPREKRHPVFVYIDEFQDYLALPTDVSDALTQARGLGLGLTLAHQHLHQVRPEIRGAVLANARSKICFQLAYDDAKVMAATSTLLGSEDFASLGAHEFYASLMNGSAVSPWLSGRSFPASQETSDPSVVRQASRRNFGIAVAEIDRQLEDLVANPSKRSAAPTTVVGGHRDDLAPRRRARGEQ